MSVIHTGGRTNNSLGCLAQTAVFALSGLLGTATGTLVTDNPDLRKELEHSYCIDETDISKPIIKPEEQRMERAASRARASGLAAATQTGAGLATALLFGSAFCWIFGSSARTIKAKSNFKTLAEELVTSSLAEDYSASIKSVSGETVTIEDVIYSFLQNSHIFKEGSDTVFVSELKRLKGLVKELGRQAFKNLVNRGAISRIGLMMKDRELFGIDDEVLRSAIETIEDSDNSSDTAIHEYLTSLEPDEVKK